MSQSHLALRALSSTEKPDSEVQALFAATPSRQAVLFIHGFSGDAVNTWSDFHLMLPSGARFQGTDLFFYGYDGLRADLTASAALFRNFLDRLFTNTAPLLNPSLPATMQRPETFAYEQLTIVAHSLGAVISRWALLEATRSNKAWVKKINLVLFAPAHMGASVADLALEATSGFKFARLFSTFARFQSPLIDQLRPGSPQLTSLLTDTKKAIARGANKHLIARKVIIAEYEKIVQNLTFGDDPPPDTIAGADHTSVCKPSESFRTPLQFLEECL